VPGAAAHAQDAVTRESVRTRPDRALTIALCYHAMQVVGQAFEARCTPFNYKLKGACKAEFSLTIMGGV
jgi:hypothetical protein